MGQLCTVSMIGGYDGLDRVTKLVKDRLCCQSIVAGCVCVCVNGGLALKSLIEYWTTTYNNHQDIYLFTNLSAYNLFLAYLVRGQKMQGAYRFELLLLPLPNPTEQSTITTNH